MFTKSPTSRLREAIGLVRSNPAGVDRLDAEDAETAAKAEAEAKKAADARRKIDQDLPALTEAIAAHFFAQWAEAVRDESERVAKRLLEVRHGLIDPEIVARMGIQSTLRVDDVLRAFKRVTVPADEAQSKAAASARTANHAALLRRPEVLDAAGAADAAAARRAKAEETRRKVVEARKENARAAGVRI